MGIFYILAVMCIKEEVVTYKDYRVFYNRDAAVFAANSIPPTPTCGYELWSAEGHIMEDGHPSSWPPMVRILPTVTR